MAQNREKSSKGYVNKQLQSAKLDADVDSKYTAEDWEGFKELVSQSNIQDKDVILRVLSMYKDPEEREKQIRNLSAGFKELMKSKINTRLMPLSSQSKNCSTLPHSPRT